MLAFKNFTPLKKFNNRKPSPGFLDKFLLIKSGLERYESENEVLARINSWINENNIDVINIETVAELTSYHDRDNPFQSVSSNAYGDMIFQHRIKVWYRRD